MAISDTYERERGHTLYDEIMRIVNAEQEARLRKRAELKQRKRKNKIKKQKTKNEKILQILRNLIANHAHRMGNN